MAPTDKNWSGTASSLKRSSDEYEISYNLSFTILFNHISHLNDDLCLLETKTMCQKNNFKNVKNELLKGRGMYAKPLRGRGGCMQYS